MLGSDMLGYNLYPKAYPHAPGYPQVDIVLRRTPTGLHFDPQKMHLSAATPTGSVSHMTVIHPWHRGEEKLRVCAGRILLEDRVNKRVEFVTLGGLMAVLPHEDFTLAVLVSAAPIIELYFSGGNSELLAEEIETLLARRRAAWERRPGEYDHRLAKAEPLALYAACLLALCEQFQRMPRHGAFDHRLGKLARYVGEEIEIVRRSPHLAARIPSLDAIL